MHYFSSQLQQHHTQLHASKSKGFFCRWANLVILVTFLEVNLLHLSSQRDTSPFSSLKLNENKTDYTPSIYCVSFFYYCLAFCTAFSPFTYDIVILWVCKWQLTSWVGVNAAVHSVAIGERRKQVINNINLISSIEYYFENDIYESTGCNIRTYKM